MNAHVFYPDKFEQALAFTLKWEGGYVNNPHDSGGATNYGITQSTYDGWRKPLRSVKAITLDEVAAIYKEKYWNKLGCDAMTWPMALVHFDTGVNFGVGRAQQFIKSAALIAEKKKINPALAYVETRIAYRYARVKMKPDQKIFLRGWLNRDYELKRLTQDAIRGSKL